MAKPTTTERVQGFVESLMAQNTSKAEIAKALSAVAKRLGADEPKAQTTAPTPPKTDTADKK